MTRICFLGGGFGGLYTALHLAKLPWAEPPEIILIDKSDRFMFSPLLYELITAELQAWEIAPTFLELLAGTGIEFVQGQITDIDLPHRFVSVSMSGQVAQLSYDRLVLAMGGETPMNLVPGASTYAIPFRTLTDAQRLIARLTELENRNQDKIRVCIAGAGASGVELACKISDRLKDRGRVRLVDRNPTILMRSPESNRVAAERALERRGVWRDLSTSVSAIEADQIQLEYSGNQATGSDRLPVDMVLWTVGNSFSSLIQRLGIPQVGKRILVESTMQVPDHPELFALGDLAECHDFSGELVPATAQAAFQQSQYCAWNIWASLHNRQLTPFAYLPLGEFLSLGIGTATVATFRNLSFSGMPANLMRLSAYLLRMPTLKHQAKVGWHWLSRPFVKAIARP
jgi:demethylphylloquinone reductase